jgi:hypothetical protein
MIRRIRNMSAVATIAVLTGCSGMSEQACLVADWRTVGFEDGIAGRSQSGIGNYRQSCGKHGIAPDLESYRAGHAEGVEIYCRDGNGFEVGHSGARYQGVCPADMEPAFLDGYNAGRHLFELESALRRIDNQLASNARAQENIKKELTSIAAAMVSTDTTALERVELVAEAAELGKRHAEITDESKALEQERLDVELELDDYRQTLAAVQE